MLHRIDTPGVIRRVSELFHGHDHLILGFNRFLPEGYKITLNDIKSGATGAMPEIYSTQTTNSSSQHQQYSPTGILSSSPINNEKNGTKSPPTVEIASGVVKPMHDSPRSSSSSTNQSKKQPELDHARNYVRKIKVSFIISSFLFLLIIFNNFSTTFIKVRFESQPEIYKSFLRILHTFHEEHHTIKDVYDQVADLFCDHKDLLDEFKQFLPEKSSVAVETVSPRTSSNTNRRRQASRVNKNKTYSVLYKNI